jgi:hypothetical protein
MRAWHRQDCILVGQLNNLLGGRGMLPRKTERILGGRGHAPAENGKNFGPLKWHSLHCGGT